MMNPNDELVAVLPIRYSEALTPGLQIHQFPLLNRPLQVPPSAALSGKRIRARVKPNARRIEVHIPADNRPEVWNTERGLSLGAARVLDDREKNQEAVRQREEEEPRLSEVRLRGQQLSQQGVHMLGVVRDGRLHLHPVSATHQLRPTLTYLDVLSRKGKRSRSGVDSGSESDDGPPPDPDDPSPMPSTPQKTDKRLADAKEVHVSTRKVEDKGNVPYPQGGLTAVRREMLLALRTEEEEKWEDLEFYDADSTESETIFGSVFSQSEDPLQCTSDMSTFLKDIQGL